MDLASSISNKPERINCDGVIESMHVRYWRVVAPIVGCLLVALIPAAYLSGWAQSEYAQSEYRRPITQRDEAVEREIDKQRYRKDGAPLNLGSPATFGNYSVAKPDCAEHEDCRTEQREYSDLKAQWRATIAAERAADWSMYGTWLISTITLITVLVSLYQTRTTLQAGHAAERPYVYFFLTKKQLRRRPFSKNDDVVAILGVTFRNVGRSQGYVNALSIKAVHSNEPPLPDSIPLETYPPSHAIIPNEEWPLKWHLPIDIPKEWLKDTDLKIFVVGRMIYSDAFGKHYLLRFCRVLTGRSFAFSPIDFPMLETDPYNGTNEIRAAEYLRMLAEARPRGEGWGSSRRAKN